MTVMLKDYSNAVSRPHDGKSLAVGAIGIILSLAAASMIISYLLSFL